MTLKGEDKTAAAEILELLEQYDRAVSVNQLYNYSPYPKQREFHWYGSQKKYERLLSAGNQQGKTYAGAAEMAYHLTGDYPDWWDGVRWDRPIHAWAAGEGSTEVRDTGQKLLLGEPGVKEAFGTGMIPKDKIVDVSLSRGVANAYDTVQVRHSSGGISVLRFKSYEQGRTKFQGATIDLVWLDEEPDMEIYTECLARLTATNGYLYMTFTPLKGMSDVAKRFWQDESEDRSIVKMTIDDAEHIDESERARRIAQYPEHEQEARIMGYPMMGEGRIFQIAESLIRTDPFEIPSHFAIISGLDIGIDHPTAAAWIAWDRDNDVMYVFDAYKRSGGSVPEHSSTIKSRGSDIRVAWPKDAHSRDKGSGKQVIQQYKAEGVRVLDQHSQFEDGSVSVEAGIQEMDTRMRTGRFKVFSHLAEWFQEFRQYHRKDGQIVKKDDDLLSATRYAVMMKRFARPRETWNPMRRRQAVAADVDYDIFG